MNNTQRGLLKSIKKLEGIYGSTACWPWPVVDISKGYGKITMNGKRTTAHRVVWETLNGPIPTGKLLCHHCDNRKCVNPVHLYVGNNVTNAKDMIRRGRGFTQFKPGEEHPKARLTVEQVEAIRASPESDARLAADHGVNHATIWSIRAGKNWTSI